MPLPKLGQLQSRPAASRIASAILLLVFLTICSPTCVYAAEVDSIRPEDHNHNRLLLFTNDEEEDLELREVTYESEFLGLDRGITGRAEDDILNLTNNVVFNTNVPQGVTFNFIFTSNSLWGPFTSEVSDLPSPVRLRRRDGESDTDTALQEDDSSITGNESTDEETEELKTRATASTRTLYITVNTCMQPSSNTTVGPPAQLEVYLSTSNENQRPGPNVSSSQGPVILEGGAASLTLNASGNVYIGLYAPNNTGFTGIYNAEVAASIDAPYHFYNTSTANLYLTDSDYRAALLVTNNLTQSSYNTSVWQEWMSITPPFVTFANNQNDTSILGVAHSYCGLQQYAEISPAKGDMKTSMTDRGLGKEPKQQFYLSGLTNNSNYYGIMALPPNSETGGTSGKAVVGGGGIVWKAMNFSTIASKSHYPFIIISKNPTNRTTSRQ